MVARTRAAATKAAEKGNLLSATIRIGLNYLKLITTLGAFQAKAPEIIASLQEGASTVSNGLSFNVPPVACAFDFTFVGVFWATMCIPLVILVGCALVAAVLYARAHCQRSSVLVERAKMDASTRQKAEIDDPVMTTEQLVDTYVGVFLSSVIILIFLTYQTILSTTVSVFDTYDTDIDGKTYLNADFRITTDSDAYDGLVVGAIISMGVYVVGIPVIAAALLYRNKERLHVRDVIESYGFLFLGYEIGTKSRVDRVLSAREQQTAKARSIRREERLAVQTARSTAARSGGDPDEAGAQALKDLREQRDRAASVTSGEEGGALSHLADSLVEDCYEDEDGREAENDAGAGGGPRRNRNTSVDSEFGNGALHSQGIQKAGNPMQLQTLPRANTATLLRTA